MFTLTIKDQNGEIADSFSFDHGSYVVGRLDSCDIVLPSNSVSREHARIFIENDRCYVEDLNSANGVIVDGQRVVQTRDLGTASQIRVGEFYLYLEYDQSAYSKNQDVMSTLFIDSGSEHHKLVRVNDAFAGEEFSLSEQENTIGRTDDNFILLSDPSISRHHAVIHRRGDLYSIEDRGSSNGTRLNGKEVTGVDDLSAGDQVEFGNVQFIFAEGDASVDPSQYPRNVAGMSNIANVAVFLVVGLAVGGAAIFGFLFFLHSPDDEADPLDTQVQQLINTGESQLEAGNLESAAGSFDEALDLAPDHEQARQLRDRIDEEQQGLQLLEEGRSLYEEGRHSDARDTLLQIPEQTRARERASETLAHVDGTIRHNLTTEARRLMRQGDDDELRRAHDKLSEAHHIDPDDETVQDLIEQVEDKLDDAEASYEPIP